MLRSLRLWQGFQDGYLADFRRGFFCFLALALLMFSRLFSLCQALLLRLLFGLLFWALVLISSWALFWAQFLPAAGCANAPLWQEAAWASAAACRKAKAKRIHPPARHLWGPILYPPMQHPWLQTPNRGASPEKWGAPGSLLPPSRSFQPHLNEGSFFCSAFLFQGCTFS